MPYPFQIIQSSKYIMMIYTFAGAVRTVYMDEHKEAPADSWMGWSNGRWDGETLVIDSTGFNDMSWFDRAGDFHSDELHIVERISAASPDRLNYEATIEDKNVFSRPWKISMPLYRRVEKNMQIMEFKCVEFHDLRSEEHTSELQSQSNLVCRLLLEKKKTAPLLPTPGQRCSESQAES